ncbi:serine hydrolase [Phenylobacterium aquaticum]|uniref:serine hydrolase domain-containing protein n=1 Tax=Phenylobacterium aquaticum TaxID=1763816 RepID=UPI0026ECD8AC|nr:serine hydrolase [Phenylobacterium aquaticum]
MTTSTDQGANLSNWRTSPFNVWAFHHVREIVPVAEIAAGPGPARALPEALRSFDDFRVQGLGGQTFDWPGFLEATSTDAVVILLNGEIVSETYAHGNAARTPHILMSATKSVTGLICGVLADQGRIDLDTPVSALLPEAAASAWGDATLRQLLDMRTGVVMSPADLQAYADATQWDPVAADAPLTDLLQFFATTTTGFGPHGGPFSYVSANTDLLGLTLARVTGQSFATLVETLLWRPMGAETDAQITVDRLGAARCTGGLCATARDLARLGQLVADGGVRDGRRVLPAAWLDDLWAGGDRQAWRDGQFAPAFPGREMSYRGGWYRIHGDPDFLFAMGIHGQNLFIDRTSGLVIAKLSSIGNPFDPRVVALIHRGADALRNYLVA